MQLSLVACLMFRGCVLNTKGKQMWEINAKYFVLFLVFFDFFCANGDSRAASERTSRTLERGMTWERNFSIDRRRRIKLMRKSVSFQSGWLYECGGLMMLDNKKYLWRRCQPCLGITLDPHDSLFDSDHCISQLKCAAHPDVFHTSLE